MRRTRIVASVAVALSLIGGVASAVVGTPEIDNANVDIRVQAAPTFTPTRCAGEDGMPYVTYRGGWRGSEADVTPGSTDYDLNGALTVGKIEWTVNLKTRRGVLTGVAVLTSPASGLRTYAGPITLITQGLPTTDTSAQARGWLSAPTYTQGQPDGGRILANVEMQINSGFTANGGFGDAGPGFGTPNFSVATAGKTC